MKRRLVLLILILLSAGAVYWLLDGRNQEGPPPEPIVVSDEEKTRRLLLGVWHDNYKAKRTMTLNEDGTGTMLVELSGLQAVLFARELRFDMEWSLEDNVLKKRTVGGEPAGKVKAILSTMGDSAADVILELTEDRLLLLDKDGATRYDWRRQP